MIYLLFFIGDLLAFFIDDLLAFFIGDLLAGRPRHLLRCCCQVTQVSWDRCSDNYNFWTIADWINSDMIFYFLLHHICIIMTFALLQLSTKSHFDHVRDVTRTGPDAVFIHVHSYGYAYMDILEDFWHFWWFLAFSVIFGIFGIITTFFFGNIEVRW